MSLEQEGIFLLRLRPETQIICNPVHRFIVTTSKLPAASTLYSKGILFANVHIIAIKAFRWLTSKTHPKYQWQYHMAQGENSLIMEIKCY